MSRIVVVTPSLPLPFGKADARWLSALLPELARRGHDVMCVSCTTESCEAVRRAGDLACADGYAFRHVPFVVRESLLVRKLRSLRRPHSELGRCAELRAALIEENTCGWDLLQCEDLYTASATRHLPRAVTYLYYLGDVDWSARDDMSLRDRLERVQLQRASRQLLNVPQPIIAMTERLATEVERHGATRPPVASIGLDVTRYAMQPFVEAPVLGIVGSMHWQPSRAAAERILRLWPQIRAAVPDAVLKVGGWNSEQYLGHWFPLEGAELMGSLESPEQFFGQVALLAYLPPVGTGMKIKVLEALAYGVPVLSNAQGLEGLEAIDGVQAAVVETDQDIVSQASALLADTSTRRALRLGGRNLIETSYTPERAVDRLLQVYAELGFTI